MDSKRMEGEGKSLTLNGRTIKTQTPISNGKSSISEEKVRKIIKVISTHNPRQKNKKTKRQKDKNTKIQKDKKTKTKKDKKKKRQKDKKTKRQKDKKDKKTKRQKDKK